MEYRIYHTIKEIVKHAEDTYGSCDAVRYKTGKDTIEAKTYRQIGKDSRHFSQAIEKLGQQGAHIVKGAENPQLTIGEIIQLV